MDMRRFTKFAIFTALVAGAAFVLPRARAQQPVAQREKARTLTGTVVDKSDAPLSGAVVYLKNTKTLTVKSYISDDGGNFRFNSLSPNVDYEVYAEYNGTRSSAKTVSSFDSRTNLNMTLRVDVAK
jgi:hypothetical protein